VAAGQLREIAFEIEQAGARRDLQFIADSLAKLDAEAQRCAAFIPTAMQEMGTTPVPAVAAKQTR
jgi:hypothetical protein